MRLRQAECFGTVKIVPYIPRRMIRGLARRARFSVGEMRQIFGLRSVMASFPFSHFVIE